MNVSQYIKGITEGDRMILSRAITLVESSLPEHQLIAQQIIEKCISSSGKSVRIGITGIPGVGKSTFINAFGKYLTQKGMKVAVLAIDPSSTISKGSILGDKTRMEDLTMEDNAFIRPTPSSGVLGGVARRTRETIILCEAAGFDVIVVETVGVGQSETTVNSMVDFFLLLMQPGAGDELQGVKRGIMEMADAVVINKADGDMLNRAKVSQGEYANALHFFAMNSSGWVPRVEICSAKNKEGIDNVWNIINEYVEMTKGNDYFYSKRNRQALQLMHDTIADELKTHFYSSPNLIPMISDVEKQLLKNQTTSFAAAKKLIDIYFTKSQ